MTIDKLLMTSPHSIETMLITVSDSQAQSLAISLLKAGESIVIPTETIFGLTCDATNAGAVAKLFQIKNRVIEKPSAIFLPSGEDVKTYAEIEYPYVSRVMEEFLPGPITVVLRSKIRKWPGVVGEDGRIGIRVSSDPFVKALTVAFGNPLIATSANIADKEDAANVSDLYEELRNRIPLVIYRDRIITTTPSTVVDLSGIRPKLIREGVVAFEKILRFVEKVETN